MGVGIGFAAGVSPGPMLGLVIAVSLERGFGAGARVAMAPLITDAPIVALTLVAVERLPGAVVRALACAGGAYLLFLAFDTFRRARRAELAAQAQEASTRDLWDLWKAVVANVLSPHPWLFWLGAGAPLLTGAWDRSPWRGTAFLVSFYLLLVGTKVVVAKVVSLGRRRLTEKRYRLALGAAGGLLGAAGLMLLWQATLGAADYG